MSGSCPGLFHPEGGHSGSTALCKGEIMSHIQWSTAGVCWAPTSAPWPNQPTNQEKLKSLAASRIWVRRFIRECSWDQRPGKGKGGEGRGEIGTRQRESRATVCSQWKPRWPCGEFWRWDSPRWSRGAGPWYPHIGQLWDRGYLEKGGDLGRWFSSAKVIPKGGDCQGQPGDKSFIPEGTWGVSLCPPTNQPTNQQTRPKVKEPRPKSRNQQDPRSRNQQDPRSKICTLS